MDSWDEACDSPGDDAEDKCKYEVEYKYHLILRIAIFKKIIEVVILR